MSTAFESLEKSISNNLQHTLKECGFHLSDKTTGWYGGSMKFESDSSTLKITYDIKDTQLEVFLQIKGIKMESDRYENHLERVGVDSEQFIEASGYWFDGGLKPAQLDKAFKIVDETFSKVVDGK